MNRSLRAFAASISAAALVGAAPLAVQAAGAVTFIQAVEPAGLDPTVGSPVAAGQVTWQNIFEGLVTIDRDGALQPQLATDWEISPDGLTYTFHLRDGVTFHNGVPFDSEVAKFSLDRLLAAESTNGQKALFTVIERVEAPGTGAAGAACVPTGFGSALLARVPGCRDGGAGLGRQQHARARGHRSVPA